MQRNKVGSYLGHTDRQNQRVVTAGPDLPAAIMTAVLLDRACRTQLTAMAAGPLRTWGTEEDTIAKRADVWSESQLQAGYAYLLRQSQ